MVICASLRGFRTWRDLQARLQLFGMIDEGVVSGLVVLCGEALVRKRYKTPGSPVASWRSSLAGAIVNQESKPHGLETTRENRTSRFRRPRANEAQQGKMKANPALNQYTARPRSSQDGGISTDKHNVTTGTPVGMKLELTSNRILLLSPDQS